MRQQIPTPAPLFAETGEHVKGRSYNYQRQLGIGHGGNLGVGQSRLSRCHQLRLHRLLKERHRGIEAARSHQEVKGTSQGHQDHRAKPAEQVVLPRTLELLWLDPHIAKTLARQKTCHHNANGREKHTRPYGEHDFE